MKPPRQPSTPPRIRLWILYEKTFLPRLRTASSSSRIALSTRPQGLRIRVKTSSEDRMISAQPTVKTHSRRSSMLTGPKS